MLTLNIVLSWLFPQTCVSWVSWVRAQVKVAEVEGPLERQVEPWVRSRPQRRRCTSSTYISIINSKTITLTLTAENTRTDQFSFTYICYFFCFFFLNCSSYFISFISSYLCSPIFVYCYYVYFWLYFPLCICFKPGVRSRSNWLHWSSITRRRLSTTRKRLNVCSGKLTATRARSGSWSMMTEKQLSFLTAKASQLSVCPMSPMWPIMNVWMNVS